MNSTTFFNAHANGFRGTSLGGGARKDIEFLGNGSRQTTVLTEYRSVPYFGHSPNSVIVTLGSPYHVLGAFSRQRNNETKTKTILQHYTGILSFLFTFYLIEIAI